MVRQQRLLFQLRHPQSIPFPPAADCIEAGKNSTETSGENAEAAVAPKAKTTGVDYADQQDVEGAKRINGAIFTTDLDTTNPLAFGITSRKPFINKNGSTFLQPSANKYATVAQYTAEPVGEWLHLQSQY